MSSVQLILTKCRVMSQIFPDSQIINKGDRIIDASDGTPLFFQWQRVADARAGVLVIHGIAEHIGRYRQFEDRLCSRGISCYGYDHRGHGRSGGKRTHVEDFSSYVDDMHRVLAQVREKDPDLPIFVFSHSMGAVIALLYVLEFPQTLRGVILSSCAIASGSRSLAWGQKFVSHIYRLAPLLRFPSFIQSLDLTHEKMVIDAYEKDPLVEKLLTMSWVASLSRAQNDVVARASKIRVPLLAIHSKNDRIASYAGMRKLFESFGSSEKTFITFEALGHELHNENTAAVDELLDNIIKWCDELI